MNIGRVLGLSDGHGPIPFVVLPHLSNGNIVSYLKKFPGKTDRDKIELVRTSLPSSSFLPFSYLIFCTG